MSRPRTKARAGRKALLADRPDGYLIVRARAMAKARVGAAIRTKAGLSIRDVAAQVGVPWPSTIHRWERGERVPRGEAAVRWVTFMQLLAADQKEIRGD